MPPIRVSALPRPVIRDGLGHIWGWRVSSALDVANHLGYHGKTSYNGEALGLCHVTWTNRKSLQRSTIKQAIRNVTGKNVSIPKDDALLFPYVQY